jgi:hypothetical protein
MPRKIALPSRTAGFIEAMEMFARHKDSEGPDWTYENQA